MRQRAVLRVQKLILNPARTGQNVRCWMTGRARTADDDPRRTLARLPSRSNAGLVGAISTDPVVIRIDLDQQEGTHRAR